MAARSPRGLAGSPYPGRYFVMPQMLTVDPGSEREQETVMAQLENATGRNIIAAAPQGKAAYEGYRGHGVLTYTVLEALNKPTGGVEETVDVYAIAGHVSRQVPAIT